MKVNVYSNLKDEEKVLLGTFEDFEKAEGFLFDFVAKKGIDAKTAKIEEVADTHKKYAFDGMEEVFTLIKHIEVVAAIIIHDGKVFSTQRGYGEFKDGWEFPGGKMEPGETMQQALERELREELAIKVKATDEIKMVDYTYPKFHLIMHCIKTTIVEGEPNLLEHEAAVWVDKAHIDEVAWLPADLVVIEEVKKLL